MEKERKEIRGGLWKRKAKSWLNYYQWSIKDENWNILYYVSLFNNTKKNKDTQPDLNLILQEPEKNPWYKEPVEDAADDDDLPF